MSRGRLATVLLLLAALAAGLLTSATDAARGRAWTHRVTLVSGELVDNWTFNDPSPCGDFGGGSVTVKFHWLKTPRVRLVLDPTHNGEPNNTLGSWVVGIPGPTGGLRDMSAQPAAGTITLVDNTSQHPPSGSSPCTPTDKSDCGTIALSRLAKGRVAGYNRKFLAADLSGAAFGYRGGSGRPVNCRIGQSTAFTDGRLSGGTPLKGELLIRMPSASSVAHRRITTVSGTTHKVTTFADCGNSSSCSDDITRRVTVTFKHL